MAWGDKIIKNIGAPSQRAHPKLPYRSAILDLYHEFSSNNIPSVRKIAELELVPEHI
jgi:hypothetical protein